MRHLAEGKECNCEVSQGSDGLVKVTKRKETPVEKAKRKKREKEARMKRLMEMTAETRYGYALSRGYGWW